MEHIETLYMGGVYTYVHLEYQRWSSWLVHRMGNSYNFNDAHFPLQVFGERRFVPLLIWPTASTGGHWPTTTRLNEFKRILCCDWKILKRNHYLKGGTAILINFFLQLRFQFEMTICVANRWLISHNQEVVFYLVCCIWNRPMVIIWPFLNIVPATGCSDLKDLDLK